MQPIRFTAAAVFVLLAGAACSHRTVETEEEVALSDVPAEVRRTIEEKAAGGTIREIERCTTGDRTVYDVEVDRAGTVSEFVVGSDGAYLGVEDDADDGDDDDDDDDNGDDRD